jgi:hypothetical protein
MYPFARATLSADMAVRPQRSKAGAAMHTLSDIGSGSGILNRFTATLDIFTRALDGIASTQRHQQQQTQDRNRCTLHAFLLESP